MMIRELELSAEYISAMNGVLNKERWRRVGSPDMSHLYLHQTRLSGKRLAIRYKDGGWDFYKNFEEDMTATDWVRIEATKKKGGEE